MNIDELGKFVKNFIKENPKLMDEVIDLWVLCIDEIQDGGSETHEIDLCINSIEQLKQ